MWGTDSMSKKGYLVVGGCPLYEYIKNNGNNLMRFNLNDPF